MTQIFDPESGVVTPVTVIEAGPCPVVQVKTVETDGYDGRAARLRRGRRAEAHAGPSSATSKRSASAPHRTLVEFRGGIDGAVEGETVTVEVVRARRRGQGRRDRRSARASRARSSATTSRSGPRAHGSHNVRAPGSIGASATPSRVFKGVKMAGRMGGKRVTQLGLDGPRDRRRAEPAARQGRRPGPEERPRRGARRLMAAPKAPVLDAKGGSRQGRLARGGRLRRRGQAAPRPRGGAGRAERAARRARMASKSRGHGLRRPREAVAPEGHRPRPRRHDPRRRSSRAAVTCSPRCRAASTLKVNRKAAKAALAVGAREPRRRRARSRCSTRRSFDEPSTKLAKSVARGLGPGDARRSSSLTEDEAAAAKSFRNLPRVVVVAPSELEVGAVVWARSLLVSEAALPARRRRGPR